MSNQVQIIFNDLPKVAQQHVVELGSESGPSETVPAWGLSFAYIVVSGH